MGFPYSQLSPQAQHTSSVHQQRAACPASRADRIASDAALAAAAAAATLAALVSSVAADARLTGPTRGAERPDFKDPELSRALSSRSLGVRRCSSFGVSPAPLAAPLATARGREPNCVSSGVRCSGLDGLIDTAAAAVSALSLDAGGRRQTVRVLLGRPPRNRPSGQRIAELWRRVLHRPLAN